MLAAVCGRIRRDPEAWWLCDIELVFLPGLTICLMVLTFLRALKVMLSRSDSASSSAGTSVVDLSLTSVAFWYSVILLGRCFC